MNPPKVLLKNKMKLFVILFFLFPQMIFLSLHAKSKIFRENQSILNVFSYTDPTSGGNVYVVAAENKGTGSKTRYNLYQVDIPTYVVGNKEKLNLNKISDYLNNIKIAVSASGNCYGVNDTFLTLEKYSPDSKFKWSFPLGKNGFKRITGITTASSALHHYIYISGVDENGNYILAQINSDGEDFKRKYIGEIPSMKFQNRSWVKEPTVISSPSSDMVYLAGQLESDSNDGLLVVLFKFEGAKFISKGIEWLTTDFSRIEKIAADIDENILIAGAPIKDASLLSEEDTLLLTLFTNQDDTYVPSTVLYSATGEMKIKSLSGMAAISRGYIVLSGEMENGETLAVIQPSFDKFYLMPWNN